MSRWGVSCRTTKTPIRIIEDNVDKVKVGTMGIKMERVTMFEMETTKISTGVTMVVEMIRPVPMFHLKIGKLILGMVEVVWRC